MARISSWLFMGVGLLMLAACAKGGESIGPNGPTPPDVAAVLAQAKPLVDSTTAYIERLIAAGRADAIQQTIDSVNTHSTIHATLSSDGVSILLTTPEGVSEAIITDAPDRSDWVVKGALAALTPKSAVGRVVMRGASASFPKNKKAIIIVPHQFNLVDESPAISAAQADLTAAGFDVAPPVLGSVDVGTMQSLGNYGVIVFWTHGAIGRPFFDKDGPEMTVLSSGMVATVGNVNAVVAALGGFDAARDKISILTNIAGSDQPFIGYTTEFFRGLGLSGTLMIADACHSAQPIGPPGEDLITLFDLNGGSLVGWNDLAFNPLMSGALTKLTACLKSGETVQGCVNDIHSAPDLVLFGNLVHVFGTAKIDGLVTAGDGTLRLVDTTPAQVAVVTALCDVVSLISGVYTFHAVTSGTAAGVVGTELTIADDIFPGGSHVLTCDNWSAIPGQPGLGGACRRQPTDPPSTQWTRDSRFTFNGTTGFNLRAILFFNGQEQTSTIRPVSCP